MNDEIPQVTLAGKDYAVLPVVFRDLSKIFPLLDGVLKALSERAMTEATLDALGKVVYHGIRRGSPDLTYEAFLDMPTAINEMVLAIPVICVQAGLKPKEQAPGEAQGAN